MRRPGVGLLAVTCLILLMTSTAIAQEDSGEEGDEESSTTTIADTGLEPAVDMEIAEEAEGAPAEETDWTYRYLIPTTLVLVVVIVLVTSVRYFSDVVRKRYRVVEE